MGKQKILLLIIILLAGLAIIESCSKSDNTPGTDQVYIQNNAYNPVSITVGIDTSVTWTNKDAILHTVTADDFSFDSGNLSQNQTFSKAFTNKGTINYHCKIHPSEKGTILVQ